MQELEGKCKNCLGCMRLEDKNFRGTDSCDETLSGLEMCKKILEGFEKSE